MSLVVKLEIDQAIDWIIDFGELYYNQWNVYDESLEWVGKHLMPSSSGAYFLKTGNVIRAIDDWSRDKTKEQVEAFAFRVIDDYLSLYLNHNSLDEMQTTMAIVADILTDNIADSYEDELDSDAIYEAMEGTLYKVIDALRSICNAFGIDINETAKRTRCQLPLEEIMIHSHYTAQEREQPKYNTLMRTHRIAAVKMLLDHTGVSKDIDKTKIAAFVEAVTGGNIDVKPQDTTSYKNQSKQAKEAAAEWLKKIGIKA